MCNLYSNTMAAEAMRQMFRVERSADRLGNAAPLSAIFPKGDAPIVRLDEDGARLLEISHWGFVLPQTSKKTGNPIQPKAVNNARDDKLRSSPFWKSSFVERRCLVPATSFCEAKGRNPATYVWFGLDGAETRPPFAFAGVWRAFRGNYGPDAQREMIVSSVITTKPNDLVRETHPDRMPVILDPTSYNTWLTGSADEAYELIAPFPADRMVIHQQGEGLKSDRGGLDLTE